MFEWSIIHGYSWKGEAHINCLELQTVLNAVKWRLRKAARCKQRVLRLVDSQVVAAILAKGRSSSFRLQLTLSKFAALVVASGTVVAVRYVDTRFGYPKPMVRWASCAQVELQRKRAKLTLKGRMVSQGMMKRYHDVVTQFLLFAQEFNYVVQEWDQLDEVVSEWLGFMFHDGKNKTVASDGLAG